MNNLLTFIFVLTSVFIGYSQLSDLDKSFSQIVKEKTIYFNNQKALYGEGKLLEEGSEYQEYLKWYEYWKTRLTPEMSVKQYYEYLSTVKNTKLTKSVGNLDNWTELGPFDKPIAGINDIGNGGSDRGIGIIHSLIVNKINPNKLLAFSRAGGLYYSMDKGQNWSNAGSDKWWRSGCSGMAFAPNNETTWYGVSNVGGTHYWQYAPIGDGGVYRTDNSGLNWSIIGDKYDFNTDPAVGASLLVLGLKIDPLHPNIGYLATNAGLYKSNNINDVTPSNVVWVKVLSDYIEDIEFKTDASNLLIVSRKNSAGLCVISTSVDQGVSFVDLISQPFLSSTNLVVIEVSDNNPNLLFIKDAASITTLRIYDFVTQVWTTKYTFNNQVGWGHGLGVSNFNANIIYVSNYDRFMKSTDGGTTFNTVELSNASTRYHADVEDIVTPPASCTTCSNEVYVTTHGGVNYSNDNTATLSTRSSGLGIAKIQGTSNSVLNPEKISLGLDHDGSVLSNGIFSQNWTPEWKTIYGGDGGSTTIDNSNSNDIWCSRNSNSPASYSTNMGSSFVGTDFPLTNDFYVAVYQNKQFSNIVYTKGRSSIDNAYEEIYRSSNYGIGASSVEQISDFKTLSGLPTGQWIWGVYPAESNPNFLYTFVNSNSPNWITHFYKNSNILSDATSVKNSWVELPFPSSYIMQAVDTKDANIVYFSEGGTIWTPDFKLYKINCTTPSTALSTQIDIAGDLPEIAINSFVLEKGTNGGMYVSSELGVYYTDNFNIISTSSTAINYHWIKIGSNLPNIPLGKLEINYIANKIRVSTPGRGIWEHDLFCPNTTSGNYSGTQSTSNYYQVYNEINSTATIASNTSITYRAGTYILLNPGFNSTPSNNGTAFFEGYIHPCMYVGSSPNLKKGNNTENIENLSQNENLKINSEITIFPNPSESNFTLNIENDEKYDIFIYNNMGTEVYKLSNVEVKNFEIDGAKLQSGIYIVRCVNNHDFKSITFIKK
ncbi:MAG: T9SS type A sorting domain-containing protein [Flavobacteriia bacterium]|nr:T9SS type A sorting domain-containing protein [Flavobacteriia bacterium]